MSRLSLQRAGEGSRILDFCDEMTGCDPDQTITQTLVRIIQYCHHTRRDFDEELTEARMWAEAEQQEPE